jgi:aminomethyltransferase
VTGVRLEPGDTLTVVDRHGRQEAELTVLRPDGTCDGAPLGIDLDAPAATLRGLSDAAGRRAVDPVFAALLAAGVSVDALRAVLLFGPWSRPGARDTFVCTAAATALVAAPARSMRVDDEAANPPSDLLLEIRRAAPRPVPEQVLPEPLAEPLLDLRIDASMRRAIRSRPASTYRSSTSRAGSARTSWPSTVAGWPTGSSAGWTARPPGR